MATLMLSKRTTFLVEPPCALPQFCPKSGKEMGSRVGLPCGISACWTQGSANVPVNRVTTTVAGRSVMKAGKVGGCPPGTRGLTTSTKNPSGLGPCLLICSYYFKADNGVSFLLLQDI